MLSILVKELFNSPIFSREETLKIENKKIKIISTGNKVIIDNLLKTKNK